MAKREWGKVRNSYVPQSEDESWKRLSWDDGPTAPLRIAHRKHKLLLPWYVVLAIVGAAILVAYNYLPIVGS